MAHKITTDSTGCPADFQAYNEENTKAPPLSLHKETVKENNSMSWRHMQSGNHTSNSTKKNHEHVD